MHTQRVPQVRALRELLVGGGGEGGAGHGHQHRGHHQRPHHVPVVRLSVRGRLQQEQLQLPVSGHGRRQEADYSLGGA